MEFVYLMKNMANGYYKIGRSNNPEHRERTLQAEEPDVRLLASVPGSRQFEQQLQRQFSANRIRGEWFSLSYSDLRQAALVFSVDFCKLDPPIRVIEDRSWRAQVYKYSPMQYITCVARRTSNEILFSVPFELCRSEIQCEIDALVMGCVVPDEMYELLQRSLRNFVRDCYPTEGSIIELRELCCLGTGESRGFWIVSKLYRGWYFIREDEAQVVFRRLKRCHDTYDSWGDNS